MASVVQSVVRAFAVLRTSTAQLIAVVDPYLAELVDCYGEDAGLAARGAVRRTG